MRSTTVCFSFREAHTVFSFLGNYGSTFCVFFLGSTTVFFSISYVFFWNTAVLFLFQEEQLCFAHRSRKSIASPKKIFQNLGKTKKKSQSRKKQKKHPKSVRNKNNLNLRVRPALDTWRRLGGPLDALSGSKKWPLREPPKRVHVN